MRQAVVPEIMPRLVCLFLPGRAGRSHRASRSEAYCAMLLGLPKTEGGIINNPRMHSTRAYGLLFGVERMRISQPRRAGQEEVGLLPLSCPLDQIQDNAG